MKNFIVFIFAIALILTSCGGDSPNSNNSTFKFDNKTFTILPSSNSISEIKMNDVMTLNGVTYNRSTITIVGMLIGGTETARISLDLYYKANMTVAGAYTIDDDINGNGFNTFLGPLDRACLGWTTAGSIIAHPNTLQLQSNNPSGTVKITVNSATNYTINYVGAFKVYDSSFNVTRTVPAEINVTGTVTIQ